MRLRDCVEAISSDVAGRPGPATVSAREFRPMVSEQLAKTGNMKTTRNQTSLGRIGVAYSQKNLWWSHFERSLATIVLFTLTELPLNKDWGLQLGSSSLYSAAIPCVIYVIYALIVNCCGQWG